MSKLTTVLWCMACVLGVSILACTCLVPIYGLHKVMREARAFPSRAAEARPLIEAIYQYEDDHNQWPESLSKLVPEYLDALPAGWHYTRHTYEPEDAPVLGTTGPLNMYMIYRFAADRDHPVDAGWIGSWEGDRLDIPEQQVIPPRRVHTKPVPEEEESERDRPPTPSERP